MASRRTFPIPNKKLSGSDYITNKRAKQLFSGTSDLAKTIEEQNGNFPLLTSLGKLKPYQGTFSLSGRYDTSPSDKTYCLNTSHSYQDLLSITKGKYLLTPPNVPNNSLIQIQDVNDPTKLYNGIYYVYIYSNTTDALYYMNPAYPSTPATYIANKIQYDPAGNANERIIVDPSFILHYQSQSCILRPKLSPNIEINNDHDSRFSFNRTLNLDLFTGFKYPIKFSLDYDKDDCINASNDLQSKYTFPSPPVNISLPQIIGSIMSDTRVGSTITLDNYEIWTGYPSPTLTYQWYRGDTPIPLATNITYIIQAADVGQLITCRVTGYNASGSDVAISNSIIPTAVPENKLPPTISGTGSSVGSTLTSSTGSWSGYPTPTLTYQWYRGDTPIPLATNNSYTIVTDDAGYSIICKVTGTNTIGSADTTSISIIPTSIPFNILTSPPIISGTGSVGFILTCSTGTWTGYPTPTLTYQWYRGDTPIPSATTYSYAILISDVGYSITCRVTGTNTNGSAVAISTPITLNGPPVNKLPPTISGTGSVGSTLTSTTGSWSGYPTPTFTYQWYRGDIPILSATNNSYIIQTDDIGKLIICKVTGTNTIGSAVVATSNSINPIDPPLNNLLHEILGTGNVGSTLTSSTGSWSGYPTPTLTYQWYRGDTPIPSATNNSYTIVTADVGQLITCRITATNTSGSAVATSISIIPTALPVNTLLPLITGDTRVGYTLTCSTGTWTGYPIPTLTPQWYKGDTPIPSATSYSYAMLISDAGHSITCRVTGTNTIGSAVAISTPIIPISPPVNISLPSITGDTRVGSRLTSSTGSWLGYPTITFTYQWYKEDTPIPLATNTSYITQTDDIGKLIICKVTGTNTIGSAVVATSNSINPIDPPLNNLLHEILGTGNVGSTLTSSTGSWSGYPTPTLTYQWYRGDTPIPSATNNSYTIVTADVGQLITCRITATNTSGSAVATSISIIPTALPENTLLPVVSVIGGVGSILTLKSTGGTWTGYPTPVLTYVWYRGNTILSWETSNTYVTQNVDIGQLITCRVTGTNTRGSVVATSNSITTGPPANNAKHQISGSSLVGSTLTSSTGSWSGYPTPTLTYQWYRGGYTPIPSATSNTYVTQADDVGQSITCLVTATNTGGYFAAVSNNSITPIMPPFNISPPQISGNALIGSTLTTTNGQWIGYPTPTFTYQWYRGDTPIPWANYNSYVTVNAIDVEQLITCRVTGTNPSGSFTATSNSISPYTQSTQCPQQ